MSDLTFDGRVYGGPGIADGARDDVAEGARRRRDLVEFSVAYALIALAVWTPLPWQRYLSVAALAWVAIATWRSFDGLHAMGFRGAQIWRAAWVLGVVLALTAAAVGVAVWMETLRVPHSPGLFVERYWAYAIWSFLQEFLLLNFFLLRLLRLLPNKTAAAITATALFALVHLPNPVLTPLTMIWGYAACLIFLHYRNIYIPAVAHAILGISIAITIPGHVDHNMRVGLGYLRYHEHHGHRGDQRLAPQRSQMDHMVSTVAWVMADAPMRRS